jgi:hypothetical protein
VTLHSGSRSRTLHRDAVQRHTAGSDPANFVELEIVETEPGVRGDTATGGNKPARLSTGATVKVPLFVNQGEIIKMRYALG